MTSVLEEKLRGLVQISEKKLTDILDKIPGEKDFIIDTSLLKPLERIIKVGKLREHGVSKIYKLEKNDIPITNSQRVFYIPGDLIVLKKICDKINSELGKTSENSYHVILNGRKLNALLRLLEEEGLFDLVTVYPFQWELIELDCKVLSLEYESLYHDLFLEGNQSFLPSIAKTIWSLQLLLGKPPVTVLQGKYAHLVDNMVQTFHEELSRDIPDRGNDVACFVIVDRDIDYASTLLTGATYTSLLDEVFGIKSGLISLKPSSPPLLLSSNDEVYCQIKNRHFSSVYSYLSTRIKKLGDEYKRSQELALQEIRQYIKKDLQHVAALKSTLANHVGACETIINQIGNKFEGLLDTEQNILSGRSRKETMTYIEESLMTEQASMHSILRLIALLSLTGDGFYSDEAHSLKSQFLHMYGYQHLPVFHNLERLGLFSEVPSIIPADVKRVSIAKVAQVVSLPTRRSTFYNQAQKLKLFPDVGDNYDLKNPTDLGYVFSGSYIPLVCQLVNMILKQEQSLEDICRMIPNCDVRNKLGSQKINSVLVYFIGGVTYAEISAFQLLEKMTGANIIVAGTTITNGNAIVKACF